VNLIQRVEVEGRSGSACFLDAKFNPVPEGAATLVKIVFDDGGQLILEARPSGARIKAFDPSQPRDEEGRWTDTGAGDGGGAGSAPAAGPAPPGPFVRTAPKDKADVKAIWKPSPQQKDAARATGQTPLTFHELDQLRSDPAVRFRDAIASAKAASPHGAAVEVKNVSDYVHTRNFITPDNKAGFALKGDDIVSVFKHPDSGAKGFANSALTLATQNGGRRLDAFDTVLPRLYSQNGFRAVARLAWDDKYAPPGWDYQKFGAFNGGRPDVVFMVYDPAHAKAYQPGDGKRVASYDEGVAAQTEALKTLDAEHAAREQQIPSAKPPPAPTTAMTQTELFPGMFPDLPSPKKKVEADDFKKDRVDIDSYTEGDEKRLGKFVDVWNDHIGEAPAEFKKDFLGGIPGTMSIKFQYDENPRTGEPRQSHMEIRGKLQDADGATIGTYTREIDFVENKAESAYFKLDKSDQGKNLGKQMLAANVAMYQKLGLDRVETYADIDVGGYAWAKYGYVPTDNDWYELQGTLRTKLGEGGSYTPESWEEMTRAEQNNVFETWKDDTASSFYDSEVESWRDSGGDLAQAKTQLAERFDHENDWAHDAVVAHMAAHSFPLIPADKVLEATTVEFENRRGDGNEDPDIFIGDKQTPELTDAQRSELQDALTEAFNKEAERHRGDMEPPDYLNDSVAEYQRDYWDQLDDAEKYRIADRLGAIPTREGDPGEIDADETDKESVRALIDDDDPKAIWAIADSKLGKQLLLGKSVEWHGTLDLNDEDSMARFNAYVGKASKGQALAAAA